MATVAEALHHAHQQGLVHRDIKPGNILLDAQRQAVRGRLRAGPAGARTSGKGPRYAGTPAYMSPEQARGEGHRVDGRCDIFSLGVVFYELLTGRRPFRADSRAELLEQIATRRGPPAPAVDDAIPKELERICLKALAKRASERYTTAKDLADDLRHFLAERRPRTGPTRRGRRPSPADAGHGRRPTPAADAASDQPADQDRAEGACGPSTPHDADFFLELLPGPRDRDGLPDSIRFWKTRIEETDADSTVPGGPDLRAVGLRQVVAGQGGAAAPAGRRRDRRSTSRRPPRRPRPGC